MPRKRKRLVEGSDEGKGGGSSSKKPGELDMASNTMDEELWGKDLDEGGVRGGGHGGRGETYSSSKAVEGFINGMRSCGKPLLMGEERVKESTRKLLVYLCEFVEGEKVEEASDGVLKALPGLLAWAKEVCLFVRGGGGCGAPTRGGGMSEDSPKNQSSPISQKLSSLSPYPLKEENIRYFEEDNTKYRDEVLNAALRFATACLGMMIMAPGQSACKEGGDSGMMLAPSSLRAWDSLQAVVVVEAAAGIAAAPPQLNRHLQRVRGGGGGSSSPTATIPSKQLKRQLWDYNELDFWKMSRFEIKDAEIHLPDYMVHELQSVVADYFVTAAQHHAPSLRSPRLPSPLTPLLVLSPHSPSCGGSDGVGGGVSKGLHGVHIPVCPSNAVGACIMRWACRICGIIQVITKEDCSPKAETVPSGVGGVAYCRPLLFLSAVKRLLFVVRKGIEAAKRHHEVMPVSQADKLEVWKLSTELMDSLLTATEGLIQSVESRSHHTSASSTSKSVGACSPTSKSPPSTLPELCMALSRTLNVIEGGAAVTIENIVPEVVDDIKFLAVSHEPSTIRAGEQYAALSVYCAARIIAGLPGRGAFADLLERLGLEASPNKTSRGKGPSSQVQEVKEGWYRPPVAFCGQLLSTSLRTVSDLLKVPSHDEGGGDMGMSNVQENELLDNMSRAGRKCFLVSPAKRSDLFLEEFVNSIRERGRRRASWCCSDGDGSGGNYNIGHFENDCKDVMAVPRAVADRLILTLVASIVSERIACEALTRRAIGIHIGHVSSLSSFGSATLKPWSSGGISVACQVIAILHSILKAASATEYQIIPPSTGQCKGVEDGKPSSTARLHTKRVHLVKAVKLTADEGDSLMPEAIEESGGEGTTSSTSHPLAANQTTHKQFALLFTAALEEDHFAVMAAVWRACDPWNLHETPELSLSSSPHQITSPTPGRNSPKQSSVALSWMRRYWVAWEGLLKCLGGCCSTQWEPQMFQFLNGNGDAVCLVQALLEKLPFRAMAGTLRSSSGGNAAVTTNEESLHHCTLSSASSPFILSVSDISLLRKCLGGALARVVGEGSARVEGIFPPELLVAPWDRLLEHCTSGVKRGRGFGGCVSVLHTQLLASCYIAMESKERKEVAAHAFSACLTLIKEFSDLESTSGGDSSRTVVEFEDMVLNTTRWLPSTCDGLNLVSNSQGLISTLLGHVLFLLCFACDKLTNRNNETLQAGEGEGKQDEVVSLNQLPNLRGLGGNVVSGEAPPSCYCVTDLVNDVINCADDTIERPPRPWKRIGHAGKVCLGSVVDVYEMRTQLFNVLSSAVIVAQPQPFHGPDLPVGLNVISAKAEADKRCIEGCFLFFAAWKLLAYLPCEDLISLTDSMRNPAIQKLNATCTEEGHPEATTMSALWIASYARSVLMLLPAPESEFSSPSHEEGRNDKVCSQLGSPYFDGLLRAVSGIDLREISDTFQERLRWLVDGAELEEFPNGILCGDVNLMGGCEETGRRDHENDEEVEDSNQAMIDSSFSFNTTNEGDARGIYHGIRQNWEEGRENDVSTPATAISQRREAHASLQAVGVCVQAACASAQSEALELKEAGLSFSSDRTDSVVGALSHWTSLFERCLEHFLFILKGGLMELHMIEKDWDLKNDVEAAEDAIEVLMLVEWPDIKEAAVLLGLPAENLEVLRDTITATPSPRVQLGSEFQRSLSLRTVSSSAHSSPSSTACMEPERVALARGSASQCMWEYVLNVCIATALFPGAGTTIPTPPTTSQQKERGKRAPSLPSPMFVAILEECTSAKNTLLEVFDGLLALLSLIQTVIGNEKPNELSVDLADAIRLANESLAHPWLSALRLSWMNTITEMQGGDDRLSGEVADAWKIHSAGRVLSSLVQQPTRWGGQGAMKAALHAIALLRTLVQSKGPRILQEYYLSGIETPDGICRRPQQWEYKLLDMFSVEVSDAVPSLIPIPDVCDLLRFIAAVPEHSKEAMGLLKNLVCKHDRLEDEEWDYEWPMLITPLVNLLVSWTEDELRCVLFAQLDQNPNQNQNQNQKSLLQQDKQPSFKSPSQCDKSSQAKDFIAILCSLLGQRYDDGLVKDGAGERIDLGVEEDQSSVPPLLELAEAEEGKDTTGGGATLACDEESEKDGSRSVAALSSEKIRRRHKRRRSIPDRPPHHNVSFRPMRISRKPFKDMDNKSGFKTKPCGSYVIPGRNELHHRVLDILIQLAHSWIPLDETHCSNGISNLVVWLASKCDKLPRLLSVVVEVGLKMANTEDTGFPRVQPLESTSYSHTVRLRSILQCLSLAKHLLDPLSRPSKTNKQSGSDQETFELKATLDDLELVPQLGNCSDGVTESFEANRNTKGMVSASESTTGANRCDEVPIKLEKEKRTCTYVESSGDFVEQHWYNCFTCGLVNEKGCCSVCIKVCHAGHSVSYSRFSSYFCDCGAGEGPSKESQGGSMSSHPCKCLNPIIPEVQTEEKKDQWLASSAPHEVTPEQTNEKEESVRSAALALQEMSSSGGITPQCGQLDDLDLQGRHSQQQSSAVLPAVWSEASQHSLYNDMNWLKDICLLLRELLTLAFGEIRSEVQTADDTTTPYLTLNDHPLRMKALALGGGQSTDLEGSALHQPPSICEGTKKLLLSPFWCAKQGTFIVASQIGNSQQQQNLAIMSGHRVVKRCIDADSRGRIAIAESKHVLIVDPTNFLMGSERKGKGQMSSSFTKSLPISAMADRSYVGTLSNTDVGFDVIGLAFNSENEQHLAVWGLSRVVVLTGQNKASVLGEPRSQLKVDLSFGMGVDSSTFILKAMWIPNSQVLLVVVCVQFVRVYDLSKDVTIPIHTLFLPATSSEEKGSSTFICDSVLLPTPPECTSSTSLHPSFDAGRMSGDATTPPSTTSNLAATVLILTNHGKLFSKGIPKPTQTVLEDRVQCRRDSSSPSPSSPKNRSNQDCEIRHHVIIPSHLLLNGSHHPSKGVSLYYSAPTGMVLYCTDSTFVLALAMAGTGDECEVVGGLPCNPIPGGQLGQDGSGSEDSSQKHQQPPPQYIGCVYASFTHSPLFNSKTSGGWNSWNWDTQTNATAGSWDKEEMNGVVDNRSTLLLCAASTKDSNRCGGLALNLRAKNEKGEGVEIATQTLPWGSSPHTEILTQPSVNSSSSGELLFKEPTFSSSEDTKGMGGVQGICVCPAFHGRNFAAGGGITGKGSSVPFKYPLSVLVLYESGGLQCFRMVNDECKKQWRSVDALSPPHDLLKSATHDHNGECLRDHPSSHDIFHPKQSSSLSHRQGLDLESNVEGEGEDGSFQANSSGSTSWPVDVFEHLHRVTTDPRLYLGGDMVGEYTPDQILSKLCNGGDDCGYIMMPRLCGGSVSLHLKHPSMQIAAVRVQVGTTSSEHRPQVIRVMGKAVPVIADRRQWYDFILSDDDMLHCEHMGVVTVSVSSTKESGHHPAITGLEVYATKRSATPSHIPVIAKAALPKMGSEEQVEMVDIESVASESLAVAGNQCGNKVDFAQSTLEACMEVVVEAVSIVSTRSIVPERRREAAERGNGNEEDGGEQSSLSQLQNLALDTLSHTVLLFNVSKWMTVRKLCRSIIFYINESSEQSNVLIKDWKNTSLGMIDTAQLKAIHGILLSPQLPMGQLRQCIRFCALVCRDRPDHRNPAIDSALCVSAFFRARWHCGGPTSELAGVVHDLIRCICLETECRRIDKDKRKGNEMIVNDVEGHSATETEVVGSSDDKQLSILTKVVDQFLLLLCGPSAHLSCVAADQLVGVLIPPNRLSQLKTPKTLTIAQMNPLSHTAAMQQCIIQKDHNNWPEEFSTHHGREETACKPSSACSDSDASVANGNDVTATGAQKLGDDVDELEDVPQAIGGGVGSQLASFTKDLDGIATNSDAMNNDLGTDNNGEGYQRLDYRCDGCNHFPLEGIRHHCTECADFDLCHACFARIHVLGTSLPPLDSGHNVLHRVIAQVICSPLSTTESRAVIQGNNGDSDGMEVELDDSVAIASPTAQDVVLTAGNTKVEPDQTTTQPPKKHPMNLCGREEEPALLEKRLFYSLAELLFPIFVDKLPTLISIGRTGKHKQNDNASYLCLLMKLSEKLPSACTAKLIGVLEQELIRVASDLTKDMNGSNTQNFISHSFCIDFDAFCIFAKTMSHLCSLGKGESSKGGVNQGKGHNVTEQKTQHRFTAPSTWNGMGRKLPLQLCELLRSILGNYYDAVELGRVPFSGHRGGTSVTCYGRDGTPMSPSVTKFEMMTSPSFSSGSEDELLIPISKYSVLSYEDQPNGDSNTLGCPCTCSMSHHHMVGSSGCLYPSSPALHETLHGIGGHKVGVTDSNNNNRENRTSRSGRNVLPPDFSSSCTAISLSSPKYSRHMSVMSSLLKLGYTLAAISKRNLPCKKFKWGKEWILQLCKIIGNRELNLLHRSAKSLLCKLCGSQTLCHHFRDEHLFATEVRQLLDALSPAVQQQHPPGHLHHEKSCEDVQYSFQVAAKISLDVLLKAVEARPGHWQSFCSLSKIPSLDDSWPLLPFSAKQGQSVASSALAIGDDDMIEGGGKVSCRVMDFESGEDTSSQPPVRALLSLLWLTSVPDSLKVGILDLLEKAMALLPAATTAPLPIPLLGSTGETTTTTQSAGHVKGRRGRRTLKKVAVQTSESLPALFLLTDGPDPHSLLIRIAKELVLSCPSRDIRRRAANLVFCLWRTSPESSQGEVVRAMAKDMPESTLFGMRSREWLQLMRNITSLLPVGRTEHQQVLEELTHALYEALVVCKCAIVNHPNAAIYETTEALLNTSDCYLDQLPCPNCPGFTTITEKGKFSSDLQQPHQSSDGWTAETHQERGGRKNKESAAIRCEGEGGRATHLQKGGKLPVPTQSLESICAASRTSESAVIVKLAGSYCIEQLDVRVSDAHGRLVKTINIYHHAPAVSSINELRLPNNAHKWQRCAILCLGPDETSATVELPLPLQTCALMFEFASFHQDVPPQGGRGGSRCKESIGAGRNGGIGWGTILCPRCGCTVIDHHGVCQQCGEVAFQCKQCRHINYEHLDAFLCVECGYCAYGTFNWRVAAKPVISLTHVSSSADREDALQALTAADIKARGYQESIMSLRAEVQQLVMTLGKMGGSGSGVAGTALVPFYAEHEELVQEMMKDAKNNTTITTAAGGPANNLTVTPFLRSLFVGVFPDDMPLDGSVVETVDSDRAGEEMTIDDDDDDDDDDDEGEVEGERGGGNSDSSSQLVAGERTAGMGRGGGSVAKRTGILVSEENRRRGGVTAESRDPCEAIDALDHILSLSLSQSQPLGNRGGGGGGGEIGLSFEDCIHVTRNHHSSPGFVRAAVAAITRRGDNDLPYSYHPLSTYRNPEGRVNNNRNRRGTGGLAGSGRAESGEKGGSDSAADPALNQDPRAQNGIVSGNNAACNQSSSLRNVSNGVAPAVESLLELYCGAGRYMAIHLRETCETIFALRKSLRHYQLQTPPQPYRQRYYLENIQDKPFISTTEIRKNGGRTCYPCNREVAIQLLLTLSSLCLRGYQGQGTMLEDLLMSLLKDGIQIGSSSCKAVARQCVISILKGSPKRACDVVLKHLEARFNLALTHFPTGSDFCSCLGDEWLLFRDLLLGPKSLVGYQEQQEPQQQTKEDNSSSTETEESKTAGKGGLKRKAKGALLQADMTSSTGPAVGAATFQESWVASALSVPFLFSLQPKQLNAPRERLISILFSILTRATEGNSKTMITHVALPTLSILAKVYLAEESREGDLYASSRLSKEALDASSGAVCVVEDTCWKSSGYTSSPLWITISQARRCNLAKKYCLRWLQRVSWLGRPGESSAFFNQHPIASCDVDERLSYLKHASPLPKHFMWSMLVTPHSAQARTLSGLLLLRLVQGGSADHIDMLESAMHVFSVMPLVGAEEEALPCLALASALWQTPSSTAYMAARGLIPAMLQLLIREADWLQKQEVQWTYSYPIGGNPVGSQNHVRSGDLLLRCAEVLLTYCSSCSAYGFSWASPTPLKLVDATSILQVVLKMEGLVLVRTVATTRAATVCRRMLMPFDAVIHVRAGIRVLQECASASPSSTEWNSAPAFTLPISSVHKHLHLLADIVAPPIQVPCFPVLMRREPSHDVYFRGSLTCNPFLSTSITSLQEREEILSSSQGHIRVGGEGGHGDPTMDDLRHRIAYELDMADAAELLELLVCDCIISPTIPLRLVFEKLWRSHVYENREGCDSETEDSHEPEDLYPMTITYRLGGVDGEATEDKIDSLDDDVEGMVEAEIAERKIMTTAIGEEGGLPLLLGLLQLRPSAEKNVQGSLGAAAASSTNDGGDQIHHPVQEMVMHHEYHDIVALALRLLKHCCEIRDNMRKLLKMRAPGILLHRTVEVLRGTGSRQARQFTLDSLLSIIEALAQELTEQNSPSCTTTTSSDNASTSFDGIIESNEGQKKNEQPVEPGNGAGATIELNTISRIAEQQYTAENERYVIGKNSIVMEQPKVDEVGQGSNSLQADEKSATKLGNGDDPKAEVFEGGSCSSSSQQLQSEEEAMEVDEDVEGQHLHFLLDALKEKSMIQVLRDAPALMRSVSRLLPFLTYAKPKAIQALADQFGHVVTWEEEEQDEDQDGQDEDSEREEEVMTQSDKETSDSMTRIKSEDGASEEAKAARDIRRKCFEEALDTMACDRAGDAVRSALIDTGFLLHCCHFVLEGLPSSDAPWADWEPYCRRDKLDRALRVLTGLTRAHKPSQAVLFEAGLLTAMHRLERTPASISGEVGLLAETLLESMAENNRSITSTLSELREKERALKHAQASAQRDKALLAMQLPVMGTTPGSPDGTDGGTRDENLPASGGLPAWMEEMNKLEEETGLTCMVCREGYDCSPREILGAYIHARVVEGSKLSQLEGYSLIQEPQKAQFEELLRQPLQHMEQYTRQNLHRRLMEEVNIGEPISRALQNASSNSGEKQKELGSLLISSTSAFNVLHFSCHRKATSADKNLRNPKSEWEGAALRNSRMACNSMLPIKNPSLTEEPRSSGLGPVTFSWARCLDKHFSNIREVMQSELYSSGGSRRRIVPAVGRLCLVLHDIRLLLMQLCYQENLSSAKGGGSLGSNIKLFWYMLQFAGNVCKTGGVETQKYRMLLPPPEMQESFDGAATSAGTLDIEPSSLSSETLALRAVSAPFRLVLSILLDDINTWTARKVSLACDMIRLIGMRRSRGSEGSGASVKSVHTRSISQGGGGEVGVKRKRSGTIDTDEAFDVEKSYLESVKPAMVLLGLVNKIQSLWPGSADGLLNEDDDSLVSLSEAMRQHLEYLTTDISANDYETFIKEAGCEVIEDSSLSAKDWLTQFVKEGERLAVLTDIDTA